MYAHIIKKKISKPYICVDFFSLLTLESSFRRAKDCVDFGVYIENIMYKIHWGSRMLMHSIFTHWVCVHTLKMQIFWATFVAAISVCMCNGFDNYIRTRALPQYLIVVNGARCLCTPLIRSHISACVCVRMLLSWHMCEYNVKNAFLTFIHRTCLRETHILFYDLPSHVIN